MINKTDGINMIVKIFIEKILFELRGSVSNYPPRLELPRLTVCIHIYFNSWITTTNSGNDLALTKKPAYRALVS